MALVWHSGAEQFDFNIEILGEAHRVQFTTQTNCVSFSAVLGAIIFFDYARKNSEHRASEHCTSTDSLSWTIESRYISRVCDRFREWRENPKISSLKIFCVRCRTSRGGIQLNSDFNQDNYKLMIFSHILNSWVFTLTKMPCEYMIGMFCLFLHIRLLAMSPIIVWTHETDVSQGCHHIFSH